MSETCDLFLSVSSLPSACSLRSPLNNFHLSSDSIVHPFATTFCFLYTVMYISDYSLIGILLMQGPTFQDILYDLDQVMIALAIMNTRIYCRFFFSFRSLWIHDDHRHGAGNDGRYSFPK